MKKSALYSVILIFTIHLNVDGTTGLILSKGLRPQSPKRPNAVLTTSPKVSNIVAPSDQLLSSLLKPIGVVDEADAEVPTQNSSKTKPGAIAAKDNDKHTFNSAMSSGSEDKPIYKRTDPITPNHAQSMETSQIMDSAEVRSGGMTNKNIVSSSNSGSSLTNSRNKLLSSYFLVERKASANEEPLLNENNYQSETDTPNSNAMENRKKSSFPEEINESGDGKVLESENDIAELGAPDIIEYRNTSIENPLVVTRMSEPEDIHIVHQTEVEDVQSREPTLPKPPNSKAEVKDTNYHIADGSNNPPDEAGSEILHKLNGRNSDSHISNLNWQSFPLEGDDVGLEFPKNLQDIQTNEARNVQLQGIEATTTVQQEPSSVSFHESNDNGKASRKNSENLEEIFQKANVESVDTVVSSPNNFERNVNKGSDESFLSNLRVENTRNKYPQVRSIEDFKSSKNKDRNSDNPTKLEMDNLSTYITSAALDKSLTNPEILFRVSEAPENLIFTESTNTGAKIISSTNNPVPFEKRTTGAPDSRGESILFFVKTTEAIRNSISQDIPKASSEVDIANKEIPRVNPRKLNSSVELSSIKPGRSESGPFKRMSNSSPERNRIFRLQRQSEARFTGNSSPNVGSRDLKQTANFKRRNSPNSFVSSRSLRNRNNGRRYGLAGIPERRMKPYLRRSVEPTNTNLVSKRFIPPRPYSDRKGFVNQARNGRVLNNNRYNPPRDSVSLNLPEPLQNTVHNSNLNRFPNQKLNNFRSPQNQHTNKKLEAEARLNQNVPTDFSSNQIVEYQPQAAISSNQTNPSELFIAKGNYGVQKPNIPEVSRKQAGAVSLLSQLTTNKLAIPRLLFRPNSNIPSIKTKQMEDSDFTPHQNQRPTSNSGFYNKIPINNRIVEKISAKDSFIGNSEGDLSTETIESSESRQSSRNSGISESYSAEDIESEEKLKPEDYSLPVRNEFSEEDLDTEYNRNSLMHTDTLNPIGKLDGVDNQIPSHSHRQPQLPDRLDPYSKQNVAELNRSLEQVPSNKLNLKVGHLFSEIDSPASTTDTSKFDIHSRIPEFNATDSGPSKSFNPSKTGSRMYDNSNKIIKKFRKEAVLPIPKNMFSWQRHSFQNYGGRQLESLDNSADEEYPDSAMEKDFSRPEHLVRCFREATRCKSVPDIHNLCFLDCVTTRPVGQRAKRWNKELQLPWNRLIKSMHWTISYLCTSFNSVSTDIMNRMQRNPGSFDYRSSTIWLQALGPMPLNPVPITKLANALVSFIIENSNTVFTALRTVTRELNTVNDNSEKLANSVSLLNEKPACTLKNSGSGLIGASGKLMSLFEQNMVLLDVLLPGYMAVSSAAIVTSSKKINIFSYVKEAMDIVLGIECGLVYFSQSDGWPECEPENRAPILEENEFVPTTKCPPNKKVIKYVYVFKNGTRVPNQEQYQHRNNS